MKHTPLRKYNRFLKPYLQSYTDKPFETVCLFREPVDWLQSWWRFRQRDGIPDAAKSTRDMPFDDFVAAYLDGHEPPADIGRQSTLVSDAHGVVGVDRIFKYDRIDRFVKYLERRLMVQMTLERSNTSPEVRGSPLSEAMIARTETDLAKDLEIYRNIAE